MAPYASNSSSNPTNSCILDSTFSLVSNSASVGQEWKVVLQMLLAFFGVVGNILVITVITRLGKKKQSLDLYILNLAIADLGTLLLTVPLVVVRERLPMKWPLGKFVCQYVYPILEIFHGSSVWYIVVIAIERYYRIVKIKMPVQKTSNTFLKKAKITCISVWFVSFFVFSFPLYFVIQYRDHKEMTWCGPVWPSWDYQLILPRIYLCALTAFAFIIPLMVVMWTYVTIARTLNKSSAFIMAMRFNKDREVCELEYSPRLSRTEALRLRQNRRARNLLTPVALVFGISMLPLNVVRIAVAFWPDIATQKYYQDLFYIISILAVFNSSANPVIYSMVRKDFCNAIGNLFRLKKKEAFCGFSSDEVEPRPLV